MVGASPWPFTCWRCPRVCNSCFLSSPVTNTANIQPRPSCVKGTPRCSTFSFVPKALAHNLYVLTPCTRIPSSSDSNLREAEQDHIYRTSDGVTSLCASDKRRQNRRSWGWVWTLSTLFKPSSTCITCGISGMPLNPAFYLLSCKMAIMIFILQCFISDRSWCDLEWSEDSFSSTGAEDNVTDWRNPHGMQVKSRSVLGSD